MSASEGRTSATYRAITASFDFMMEMRIYHYRFYIKITRSKKGNDEIWVIMDQLTKSTLFLPMRISDSMDKLVKLYVNKVIWLHGIPLSIVYDKDA